MAVGAFIITAVSQMVSDSPPFACAHLPQLGDHSGDTCYMCNMALGRGMRVVVLVAMASLLANAQCVAECASHSCSNSSTPRCHHKAPSTNQDDRPRPCSHQTIAPSQSGISGQITART